MKIRNQATFCAVDLQFFQTSEAIRVGLCLVLLPLTFLLADAFILDYVLMVERLQDLDLARQVGALLLAGLGLQGLDGHQLAGLVSSGVVAAQLHLAEVALREEGETDCKLSTRIVRSILQLETEIDVGKKKSTQQLNWTDAILQKKKKKLVE